MSDPRQDRLADFVAWTRAHVTGDEKGQAQIFLDRLFQAFGQRGTLDVGGAPEMRIRKAQEDGGGTAFADYVWKPVVLIEMKRRGVDLAKHFRQAFDYWIRLVPDRPQYVVLSNFDEFWVYDFNVQMDDPVDKVQLDELPTRYGPLAFLFPTNEKPVFRNDQEAVTRRAADLLATCFRKLVLRRVPRETAQSFTLQMLVALFAEDIDLLDKYFVTRLLDECKTPEDAYDKLGDLFEAMNTPGRRSGGKYKSVPYFNGGLFRNPVRLELFNDELALLRSAAGDPDSDWSKVRPEIFGTIFEASLGSDDAGKKERHAFGAHFTSPVDIMKIVGPTIVEPWRQLIENATTVKELNGLLARMHEYHVLDPACGSGNFLYIAYRELKRLEVRAYERLAELSKRRESQQGVFGFVTAEQFFGMDINPFAVELAKVTMMIGRKLSIDELHITEPALPLDNLDENFIPGDALMNAAWPPADVIIGNPPFLDARKTTKERGRDYVKKLETLYPKIARRADYCVYWLRRAHDHLPESTPERPERGRAGLVGTQNIRNNEAREGGLDHIVRSGTIVEAVDNQPWSGEANVHVSIANWVKHSSVNPSGSLPPEGRAGEGGSPASGLSTGTSSPLPNPPPQGEGTGRKGNGIVKRKGNPRAEPGAAVDEAALLIPAKRKLWFKVEPTPGAKKPKRRGCGPANKEYELDFRDCTFINSALSDATDLSDACVLCCNRVPKVVFEGVQTGHKGFVIDKSEAIELMEANPAHRDFLRPFLNGSDLLSGKFLPHPEYVIDLSELDINEASAMPRLLKIIKERVLPDWHENASEELQETGKSSGEHQNRLEMWWALKRPRGDLNKALRRVNRVVACSAVMKRPTFVFLASGYLPTNALKIFAFDDDYSFGVLQSNTHWQWFVAKCSKLKSDFRYTPESVFDTFPWPQSPAAKLVVAVAEAGREVRRVREDALTKVKGGLRAVYRTLELPGKNPLKDAHAALDGAVLAAYGFSAKKDLLAQLLDLNLSVAAAIEREEPVTAPGVPPGFPNPGSLITGDCIRPA